MSRALIVAAPSSGAGKTTISLGLMAALRARGIDVRAAKSGPDYIDPAFHGVATGHASVNLDAWAMAPNELRARAADQGGEILIIEAAMGVLDGASDGTGSAADLAAALGVPVVLVLEAAKAGPSVGLAAAGLRAMRPDVNLAGVILNRVASPRHKTLAASGLSDDCPLFGAVGREACLALPSRHLGLVQAGEAADLSGWLESAAQVVARGIDLDKLLAAAGPISPALPRSHVQPPGQRIAVATDIAFAFSYPHQLDDWRAAGAEILPFSPLADEAPDPGADFVFLPGGYPELHAGALAGAGGFRDGLRSAAAAGTPVYGECGGYMILGECLIDGEGRAHGMLGLLPLTTSFEDPRLTLGYRRLGALAGPYNGALLGHEFHYATIVSEGAGERLFSAHDATGQALPDMGLRRGSVSGSFAHVIGPAA